MKKNSTIFLLSVALVSLCGMSLQVSAQTVIGGNTPDPSAMLDVQSNNRGFLFPRMTTEQRDDINNGAPATGLMIFNTTTQCLEINLGTTSAFWESIICPTPLVGALTCGSRTLNNFPLLPNRLATNQSFTIPYTGGNGFAYSGQSVTASSTGVTGLTATLAPGTFASGSGSLTYTIAGTPSAYGTASFDINIGGQTCVVDVPVACGAYVSASEWKVFMCHNLGATTTADPFTPSWQLNGNYYMWGTNTVAAPGPSGPSTPNPGPIANWASLNAGSQGAWTDAPNTKGPQDPCPNGFRVPSRAQWNAVISNNTLSTPAGATWIVGNNNYNSGRFFGQGLFLPISGSFGSGTGALIERNELASYWSSTYTDIVSSGFLEIKDGSTRTLSMGKRNGNPIRCIAE